MAARPFVNVTASEVRQWLTAQGYEVGSRGRFDTEHVEAFNIAHKRNRRQYVMGEGKVLVEVKAKPAKGRTVKRQINIAEARAWAVENGKPAGKRGPLPKETVEAYVLSL